MTRILPLYLTSVHKKGISKSLEFSRLSPSNFSLDNQDSKNQKKYDQCRLPHFWQSSNELPNQKDGDQNYNLTLEQAQINNLYQSMLLGNDLLPFHAKAIHNIAEKVRIERNDAGLNQDYLFKSPYALFSARKVLYVVLSLQEPIFIIKDSDAPAGHSFLFDCFLAHKFPRLFRASWMYRKGLQNIVPYILEGYDGVIPLNIRQYNQQRKIFWIKLLGSIKSEYF